MPIRQDVTIHQGSDWSFVYTHMASGSAVDLTGYSARMSIKVGYSRSTEAYLTDGPDADGGTLVLGGVAGTVTMSMTAAQTADLSGGLSAWKKTIENPERFIYDLELVSGAGVVTRAIQGRVNVYREVTGVS